MPVGEWSCEIHETARDWRSASFRAFGQADPDQARRTTALFEASKLDKSLANKSPTLRRHLKHAVASRLTPEKIATRLSERPAAVAEGGRSRRGSRANRALDHGLMPSGPNFTHLG
jgi:hypothetical protein